jgi:TatD DNase family protein
MFVDSHCHLTFDGLFERIDDVRAAMAAANVDRAMSICTTLEEFDKVHGLAQRFDNIWATAGVHPDNEGVLEPTVQDLLDRAALPRVLAIGETGLDYYRLNGRSVDDMAWQRERFRVHIRAAKACSKPLVIHTRSASADTLRLIDEEGAEQAGGVFHCFTETVDVARAALDRGFYISLSGIVTFKNAAELRDVARMVPLDRLLIETDSPYLAPMPHRGKPNQPAYVAFVASFLAHHLGIPVETLAEATSANFDTLFRPEKHDKTL